MSAEVGPMSYGVYCAECANGDGPYEGEDDAQRWADEHNAEYHNEPDRADSDYDHYKESLRKE